MKDKSKCLLISFIIGAAYFLYVVYYFYTVSQANKASSAESLGAGIAITLVLPHIVLAMLSMIFNAIAFTTNKTGFAVTCGVLYCVTAVIFPPYAFFMIPEIILSFIGVAKLSKIKKNQKNESNSKGTANSELQELKHLKELLDIDAITKDEFEMKKKQILGL